MKAARFRRFWNVLAMALKVIVAACVIARPAAASEDPCISTGYAVGYFNGIWTDEISAEMDKLELQALIGSSFAGEEVTYHNFYNSTSTSSLGGLSGRLQDIQELFVQRAAEIDASLAQRWELLWATVFDTDRSLWNSVVAAIPVARRLRDSLEHDMLVSMARGLSLAPDPRTDLDLARHKEQLILLAHARRKIVLISHSQGSLFANTAYNFLVTAGDGRSVASYYIAPAAVSVSGVYRTANIDLVLNMLRNNTQLNVPLANLTLPVSTQDLSGHTLIGTYLDAERPGRATIHSDITAKMRALDSPNPDRMPSLTSVRLARDCSAQRGENEPYDRCVVGRWQQVRGGAAEWVRQMAPQSNMQIRRSQGISQFDPNGVYWAEGDFEATMAPTGSDKSFHAASRDRGEGRWLANGRDLQICEKGGGSVASVTVFPEARTATLPRPPRGSEPLAMQYCCSTTSMVTRLHIPGSSTPITTYYAREQRRSDATPQNTRREDCPETDHRLQGAGNLRAAAVDIHQQSHFTATDAGLPSQRRTREQRRQSGDGVDPRRPGLDASRAQRESTIALVEVACPATEACPRGTRFVYGAISGARATPPLIRRAMIEYGVRVAEWPRGAPVPGSESSEGHAEMKIKGLLQRDDVWPRCSIARWGISWGGAQSPDPCASCAPEVTRLGGIVER